MARILLLLPTTTYRATDFLEAAERLRVEVTVASEEENVLASSNPEGYLALDFQDLERSARAAAELARRLPFRAVVGVDDQTSVVAARIAQELGLKGNTVESAEASRNKFLMRERLRQGGVPVPDYLRWSSEADPERLGSQVAYPCVLKPLTLAASQGVIRADDQAGFVQAWKRLQRILEVQRTTRDVLVESFIPGQEVAVEGLLDNGRLRILALFDKPDPMDGPFFEETIYVRPSQLLPEIQDQIVACVHQAIQALGLTTGPIHAEVRVNEHGPWVIEVAARPIGGRCSRVLRFTAGCSLEELILRQALGLDTHRLQSDPAPSGVMMIPIPQAGVLRQISGIEEAKKIPGVDQILFTAHLGQTVVPLPEGSSYLGFIFARSSTPERVDGILRQAHACLHFDINPTKSDTIRIRQASCGVNAPID